MISTGALDRYNSTIAVDGWQTENFEKNPVVLWAHDDSIPAIGRAANVRVEGGRLKSRATFAERDVHPLADTVYQLIKGRFIGAASVGWIPLEYKFVEDGERGFGIDFLEQELLEWSVVNIPANPDCLVGARSLGNRHQAADRLGGARARPGRHDADPARRNRDVAQGRGRARRL